jgi:hypothetical protein
MIKTGQRSGQQSERGTGARQVPSHMRCGARAFYTRLVLPYYLSDWSGRVAATGNELIQCSLLTDARTLAVARLDGWA